MIIINLKDLYPSDSQQQLTDKLNFNFNQMLRLGVGTQGERGLPGPAGPQGIRGYTGADGTRGNYWYSGNFASPYEDSSMTGSPDPKNVNDCYLATKSGNLSMWQWQIIGGNHVWHKTVNLEGVIESHISNSSPFTRLDQPNWINMIGPLHVGDSPDNWANTLYMASENQDKLSSGIYGATNAVSFKKAQAVFLNGEVSPTPYTLVLGEVSYNYDNSNSPIQADPLFRLNNTLRVSSKYLHTYGTPAYSSSVFDMYTQDDGPGITDTNTMFKFMSRRIAGAKYGLLESYLASRDTLIGNGISDLGQITDSSVDFGGIILRNTTSLGSTVAVALGTNMNAGYPTLSTPYSYLLVNNAVDRLYVNTNVTPFRKVPETTLSLGMTGNSGLTHWDYLYARSGIGYTSTDFKFWRGSNNSSYADNSTNCVMTLTADGKVAIGKNMSSYNGVGAAYALDFGNTPINFGNPSNRAVLHIYEDVTDIPTGPTYGLIEAGLLIEKRWGFLDKAIGDTGQKLGMYINNTIHITPSSQGGTPSYNGAPDSTGLFILQGQTSTDKTRGVVDNMIGINTYLYTALNAANVGNVIGITSALAVQGGIGTTTRVNSFKALNIDMPDSNYITGFAANGNAANYGIYQGGPGDSINFFNGNLQFSGNGHDYQLPSGSAVGHVIHVSTPANQSSSIFGNLTIEACSGLPSIGGSDLTLRAGSGIDSYGGSTYVNGGDASAASMPYAGALYLNAGTAYGTGAVGGNTVLGGGWGVGTGGGTPGSMYIIPGLGFDYAYNIINAGNIAIGYWNRGHGLVYNVGNIGFGCAQPNEKIQLNGNFAFGGNDTGTRVRKLYVRPGVSDNINTEGPGTGAGLAIGAGNGRTPLVNNSYAAGGNLYLYGGLQSYYTIPPALSNDGNTLLCQNESGVSIGRLGIRKAPPIANGAPDYNVHVDVSGNMRLNDGDILTSNDNQPGWTYLINSTHQTLPTWLKLHTLKSTPTLIDIDPGYCVFKIKYKRIGSLVTAQFSVTVAYNGLIPAGYGIILSWSPTDFSNHGKIVGELNAWNSDANCAQSVGFYTMYDSHGGINGGNTDYVVKMVSGYTTNALGSVPAGSNIFLMRHVASGDIVNTYTYNGTLSYEVQHVVGGTSSGTSSGSSGSGSGSGSSGSGSGATGPSGPA